MPERAGMKPGEPPALGQITASWFLFLCGFRRNSQAMDPSVEWVRERLHGLLREMRERTDGDPKLKYAFEEAQYPLVCFADEVLLTCGWAGEKAWERQLLEAQVFQTQNAGHAFFERANNPALKDPGVIEVFYKVLCLGFAGQYAGKPIQLREERERLLRRLPAHRQTGHRFCPEAYENTDKRNFVKLPLVATARIGIVTVALVGLVAWLSYLATARTLKYIDGGLDEIQKRNDEWIKSSRGDRGESPGPAEAGLGRKEGGR